MEGLEPPCLAALDPKSSASTNFATSAINFFLSTLVLPEGFHCWGRKCKRFGISIKNSSISVNS